MCARRSDVPVVYVRRCARNDDGAQACVICCVRAVRCVCMCARCCCNVCVRIARANNDGVCAHDDDDGVCMMTDDV